MRKDLQIAFLDRDGCLIKEPGADHHTPFQVCSLEEMELLPRLISGLLLLKEANYKFVMLTDQDHLGKEQTSIETYQTITNKLFQILSTEGIEFFDVLLRSGAEEKDAQKKPQTGTVKEFLEKNSIDTETSFVIGDRPSELALAKNIGISGYQITDYPNWLTFAQELLSQKFTRAAKITRNTKETQITLDLTLDGSGILTGKTQIGFLTHMLETFSKHSQCDLTIEAQGDIEYDDHHLIEDIAIVLGQAIQQAVGNKKGIKRFGQRILPLDETLALCAVDLSGRAAFETDYKPLREKVNDLSTEMVPHFFETLASNAQMSIHIQMLNPGRNEHHRIETIFKSFARAFREAIEIDASSANQLPSTKGKL